MMYRVTKTNRGNAMKPKKKAVPQPEPSSILRRLKIAGIIVLVLVLGSTITYFLVRDMIVVRPPLLVFDNPRVTFVLGAVHHRTGSGSDWKETAVGTTLKEGHEIKTGPKGLADIVFNGGSAVRVAANSSFTFDRLTIRALELRLNSGSLYGAYHRLFQDQGILIHTPTSTASVRGTELGFEIREIYSRPSQKTFFGYKYLPPVKQNQTTVYAISGITEVNNPARTDEKLLLAYQNKTSVKQGQAPDNPKKMTQAELNLYRKIIDAIHREEVLLISDKIAFNFGSATILPESYKELDSIADKLKEKGMKIRIDGHTDDIGTATINQKVSVFRAKAVREYLIGKGVGANRLFVAGFGSSKPIDENTSEAGRARNRRVEFIVVQ